MSNIGDISEPHLRTIDPSTKRVFHQLMKLAACVQIPADSWLVTTPRMGLMLIFQLITKADFLPSPLNCIML